MGFNFRRPSPLSVKNKPQRDEAFCFLVSVQGNIDTHLLSAEKPLFERLNLLMSSCLLKQS